MTVLIANSFTRSMDRLSSQEQSHEVFGRQCLYVGSAGRGVGDAKRIGCKRPFAIKTTAGGGMMAENLQWKKDWKTQW